MQMSREEQSEELGNRNCQKEERVRQNYT